jgi:hypothetical protein
MPPNKKEEFWEVKGKAERKKTLTGLKDVRRINSSQSIGGQRDSPINHTPWQIENLLSASGLAIACSCSSCSPELLMDQGK